MKLSQDVSFLYEVGCLRHVQRVWKQFLNPDFANLSEHTLRVQWIALVIAQHEKVKDLGKVCIMALAHDLSESRSVDVHYVSRQFAVRKEDEALEDTLHDTSVEKYISDLVAEYEKRESIISKIIKDADNLDVDLELQEQTARGFTIGQKLHSMRKHVRYNKLYTETAKQMWDQIYTTDPHDWHWTATNRFNSGDWKK